MKQNLDFMDFISIREDIGVNIAQDIADKTIFQNIDPVFLLDECEWKKIENKVELPKNMFLYIQLECKIFLLK